MTRVVRLEYGKHCREPEGAIGDGAEHRVLAMSPGFDPRLNAFVGPGPLRLGREAAGGFFAVRPLRVGDRWLQVAVWGERRPEQPGDANSRLYLRATVLVAGQAIGPGRWVETFLGLPFHDGTEDADALVRDLELPSLVDAESERRCLAGGASWARRVAAIEDAVRALPPGEAHLLSYGWGVDMAKEAGLVQSVPVPDDLPARGSQPARHVEPLRGARLATEGQVWMPGRDWLGARLDEQRAALEATEAIRRAEMYLEAPAAAIPDLGPLDPAGALRLADLLAAALSETPSPPAAEEVLVAVLRAPAAETLVRAVQRLPRSHPLRIAVALLGREAPSPETIATALAHTWGGRVRDALFAHLDETARRPAWIAFHRAAALSALPGWCAWRAARLDSPL